MIDDWIEVGRNCGENGNGGDVREVETTSSTSGYFYMNKPALALYDGGGRTEDLMQW